MIVYSINKQMSLKKIQWGDVESDSDSDKPQHTHQESQESEQKTSDKNKNQNQWGSPRNQDKKRTERYKFNQEQRIQQLRKLEELQMDNVWIYIYKNSNPQLSKCVDQIESIAKTEGNLGWDLKVKKQQARKLISEGFRVKKIFAIIQVGNKNYTDERKNERKQNEKRKYVVKQSKVEEEDTPVKSQFTFQKKKKSEIEKGQEQKIERKESWRNDKRYQEQKVVKDKKAENNYKTIPFYKDLGDFRNKQTQKRTVSEKEPQTELLNGQFPEPNIISTKISYKKSDKPKYIEKQQPKPKYKQKQRKPSQELQEKQAAAEQCQIRELNMIQPDSSPQVSSSVQSPQKQESFQCEDEQCEFNIQRKQEQFTKQSSSISQQIEQACDPEPQIIDNQASQQDQKSNDNKQAIKPKRKKRIRNKDKAPKSNIISNNPFSKLG